MIHSQTALIHQCQRSAALQPRPDQFHGTKWAKYFWPAFLWAFTSKWGEWTAQQGAAAIVEDVTQ